MENLINGFRSFIKKHPKSVYKLFLAGGVIKGQEESLKEIKRLIGSSKKIRYLGFLNQKRQDILYQKAYAVTIPAKLSISASGPLYHALSHGKFIIASKVGHLKDEIIDHENGLLIKNSQWAKAFAVALKEHKLVHKTEKNNLALARIRSPHRTAKK